MTLVETGTRAMIGAVFGPTATGETEYAERLLHPLNPDMLVLWDKGFDGNHFLSAVTGTGAQVLGRLRSNRRAPSQAQTAAKSAEVYWASSTGRSGRSLCPGCRRGSGRPPRARR